MFSTNLPMGKASSITLTKPEDGVMTRVEIFPEEEGNKTIGSIMMINAFQRVTKANKITVNKDNDKIKTILYNFPLICKYGGDLRNHIEYFHHHSIAWKLNYSKCPHFSRPRQKRPSATWGASSHSFPFPTITRNHGILT